LPQFARDALGLDNDQRGKVDELQKEVDAKLKELLTDAQERQLEELRGGAGFGGVAQPGQLLSAFQQARLTLTDEQRPKYDELQKNVDRKLREILRDAQRTQLTQMASGGAPGAAFAGPPGGDRRGPGGPGGRGGRGGRGGGGGFGASIFRVYRYAADFPGLRGKDLTPGKPLEEVVRGGETPSANGPRN
jgi:hypothetical protein